ncbi:MAG: hypothetical protein KGL95_06100 [Patescibacteria group bacterium]|nr:hypothetical protein [Patescibacteria group bacterium]
MARFNDTGPYALGNVKIITNSENLSEGNLGKIVSEETKKLMSTTNIRVISQKQKEATSAFHKGKKLSKEHAKALRDSNLGKKHPPFSEEWRKNQSISAKARCARQKAEKEKARNEDQVRAQSKSK